MQNNFNIPGAEFCRFLISKIVRNGSGAEKDGQYISPDRPRDRFFIGRLSPVGKQSVAEEVLENSEDFLSRLNPCAMRIRFLVKGSLDTTFQIQPSFHVYTRVFAEYEYQKKDAMLVLARREKAKLMPAFRKVEPEIAPLTIVLKDIVSNTIEASLSWNRSALEQVSNGFKGDPDKGITRNDIENKQNYDSFLASISGKPIVPEINVSLIASAIKAQDDVDKWEVSLALVNRSTDTDPSGRYRLCDEVIFNAGFRTDIEKGYIEPYEFPVLPKSYRFDRRMFGTGVNCSVKTIGDIQERPTSIWTNPVPTYEQPRFDHREFEDIMVTFEKLASREAESILKKVATKMREFDAIDWEQKGLQLMADLPDTQDEVNEFNLDRKLFKKEIERFEKGIDCLRNPMAAKAFELMNRTFRLMGEKKNHNSWRLFQIVFIVSLLPAVVGREFPEFVEDDEWDITDVVWFPTGGGKTEAYLGLTAFALFFDRLRGRNRGVTALYRFPLRLLSLQQFQRIVAMIAAGNWVKKEADIPGRNFTVGHWIGSQGSPNNITKEEANEYINNPNSVQKFRKITECPTPGCGERNITIKFDQRMWSLQHVCPSCGVLPIIIVDRELYRYLPSVVVGTVDKMAVFGLQKRFANLMGWPGRYCSTHGFAPESKCEICNAKNLPEEQIKDPVPSLHIQDELHLLKEDLGAFDSHYETSVIEMQKAIPGSKRPWKTIAATATIDEFERHVEHLYMTKGRRFPTAGPSYENTFFAATDTDCVTRVFAGVLPSGLTHINAMVAILWYFHRELARLRKLSVAEFLKETKLESLLSESQVPSFLDQYEICLNYVLTKKAGDQMAESLDAQIGNYLREDGYPQLVSEVLSGGTTSEKITEVMEKIEKTDLDEPDTWKRIRSVVATSMISHGVDVERFNFITFFGMPRMTSEYIQASSRVGRRFPGIVFVCFAPARERDRSHYHLFNKYHEYLERLVEATAINRWSRFSIEKTIPGVVLGYIFNELAKETGRSLMSGVSIKKLIPNDLTEKKLRDRVIDYYCADKQASGEFAEIIGDKVAGFFNGLPNSSTYIGKRRGWRPMRSLRDTDRAVKFKPGTRSAPLFELLLKDRITGMGELEGDPNNEGIVPSVRGVTPMTRGLGQVLFNYLPEATLDYERGSCICKVAEVRIDQSDIELIDQKRILDDIRTYVSRWGSQTDLDVSHTYKANRFAFGEPREILFNVYPLVFECRKCGAAFSYKDENELLRNDRNKRCRWCGEKLRQIYHVLVHECGDMKQLWVPRCENKAHGGKNTKVVLDLRGSQKAMDFRWKCVDCGAALRPINRTCSCSDGSERDNGKGGARMRAIPHRANAAYYTHHITKVSVSRDELEPLKTNPDREGILIDAYLKKKSSTKTILNGIRDGENTLTEADRLRSLASTLPDGDEKQKLLNAAAVIDGLSEDKKVESNKEYGLSDETIEELFDYVNLRCKCRIKTIDELKNEVDIKRPGMGGVIEKSEREHINAGITEVSLVEDFPVVTVVFGYTRVSAEPEFKMGERTIQTTFRRFPTFRMSSEKLQDKIPVYTKVSETEGLMVRIDPFRLLTWLEARVPGAIGKIPEDSDAAKLWLLQNVGDVSRFVDPGSMTPITTHVFGLIHTMSHMFVRAAASLAGVDRTGFSEYLFPRMGTFVVYNSNTEFNLGGITTLFEEELGPLLMNVRYDPLAKECMYDPVCREYLNSSCHACTHLGEMACGYFNRGMRRDFLFGSEGFWGV